MAISTRATDLVFADDAENLQQCTKILVLDLEEAKSLPIQVSDVKTKVLVFRSLLDETVQSAHACEEVIEILGDITHIPYRSAGQRQV